MNKLMILLLTCILGLSAMEDATNNDISNDREILKSKATQLRTLADNLLNPAGFLELATGSAAMTMLNNSLQARTGERKLETIFTQTQEETKALETEIHEQFGDRLNALALKIFKIAKIIDTEADEIYERQVLTMRTHS